jgi:hypothetical protein
MPMANLALRFLLELAGLAGRLTLAIVFAVLVIANRILLHVWPQQLR